MQNKLRTVTFILIVLLICIFLAVFFKDKGVYRTANDQIFVTRCGEYATTSIEISSSTIAVVVADTDCKQSLGLSGQTGLEKNSGMLFVFPKEGNYGFWMKDMHFALDIIWVNSDFVITGIEKNVPVSSYPEILGEKYVAQYVIELPAGFSDAEHVSVGEKMIF